MARPSFKPTPEQRQSVEAMAGLGIPQSDIAIIEGIDPKTLRKHFEVELKAGAAKANVLVMKNLFKIATGSGKNAITAAIFWAKVRMGWKERSVHEHTGPDGGPVEIELGDLTRNERAEFRKVLSRRIKRSAKRDTGA